MRFRPRPSADRCRWAPSPDNLFRGRRVRELADLSEWTGKIDRGDAFVFTRILLSQTPEWRTNPRRDEHEQVNEGAVDPLCHCWHHREGVRPGGDCRFGQGPVRRSSPGVTVEASSPRSSRRSVPRSPTAPASTASRTCGRAPTPSRSRSRASAPMQREGIELTGSFTATVNAELTVGTAEGNDHRHREIPSSTCRARGAR